MLVLYVDVLVLHVETLVLYVDRSVFNADTLVLYVDTLVLDVDTLVVDDAKSVLYVDSQNRWNEIIAAGTLELHLLSYLRNQVLVLNSLTYFILHFRVHHAYGHIC